MILNPEDNDILVFNGRICNLMKVYVTIHCGNDSILIEEL